jgi:peptidoglycan/LPS O-acetylase OafA/YrhL
MGLIRLLLALSVVLAHGAPLFGMTLVGGKLAVQAFFVISGFYMSLILNGKYPATRAGNLLFYGNRFLRIYPMYWATLLLTLAAFIMVLCLSSVLPQYSNSFAKLGIIIKAARDFSFEKIAFIVSSSVALFGMDLSYFMRFDLPHLAVAGNWSLHEPWPSNLYLVPQAWSLGIEVTVYAIAPFVFRRSVAFLLALLVASFVARTLAFDNGLDFDPWSYRFFPFEFGLFVVGALLYRAHGAFSIVHNKAFGWLSLALGITSIFFYQMILAIPGSALGFERTELLFVIPFVLSIPGTFAISKTWKVDRWVGELSYPIYLVHVLVIAACRGHFGWFGEIPVLGSILFAVMLAIMIETPLDRLRQARVEDSLRGTQLRRPVKSREAA